MLKVSTTCEVKTLLNKLSTAPKNLFLSLDVTGCLGQLFSHVSTWRLNLPGGLRFSA